MENIENEEAVIDLRELFKVIMDKIVLIIMITLLSAVAVYTYTGLFVTPQYASTVSLYVINRQNESQLTNSDLSASTILTADVEVLVTSRTVMEKVTEQISLDRSTEQLAEQITVNNPTNTRILEITALDEDPLTAKKIADAIADISAKQIVKLMGAEQVTIIDYGNVSESATKPKLMRNTAIGAFTGASITIAIIILFFIFDDTIRTAEDVENYLGISVLGTIPAGKFERGTQSKSGLKRKKKDMKLPQKRRDT